MKDINNLKISMLVGILTLITTISYSQNNCNTEVIRTNPDDYYNPNDPNENLKWDWRGDVEYPMYLRTSQTTATQINIQSPFWFDNTFTSQENITYLRINTAKDYEPVDGWELVYKNFGFCCNFNNSVADPSFCLYNKYNGILRVFVYISSTIGSFNGATLNLTYDINSSSGSSKISHNLNDNLKQQDALDKQIHVIKATKINKFSNNYGYWLHADFPVTYDPCVCKNLSILKLEPRIINSGDLSLEITGRAKQEVVKNGSSNSSDDILGTIFTTVNGAFEAGNKKYTSWNSFKTGAENTLLTQNDEIKSSMQAEFGQFPEWTKEIPEIGRYIGIFEYFTGGGKSENKSIAPMNFDLSLKSTSTSNLSFSNPYGGVNFYTPGSDHLNNTNEIAPVYDEPLGIFNLLETPKLELIEIHPMVSFIGPYLEGQKNDLGESVTPFAQAFPMLRSYKVKENLKYVINPSAGVNLTPLSIEAQIIFKPQTGIAFSLNGNNDPHRCKTSSKMFRGPLEIGQLDNTKTYVERMTDIGLNIDYWPDDKTTTNDDNIIENIIYSTRLLPASCFNETSFKVFHIQNDEKEIFCRVRVKLRRSDYNGTQQDILLIKTFKVDIVNDVNNNGSATYFFGNSQGGLSSDMSQNFITGVNSVPHNQALSIKIPQNLKLENTHFSTGTPMPIMAWNKIEIGNNVTFDAGMDVEFLAGKEIIITPNFITQPNFKAEIGLPVPCRSLLENSNDDVDNFCNTTYKPNPIQSFVQAKEKIQKKKKINILSLKIYPNPNTGIFNVSISDQSNSIVDLVLSDLTGKQILTKQIPAGQTTTQIETNNLANGVYMLIIKTEDKQTTQKLIINNP